MNKKLGRGQNIQINTTIHKKHLVEVCKEFSLLLQLYFLLGYSQALASLSTEVSVQSWEWTQITTPSPTQTSLFSSGK